MPPSLDAVVMRALAKDPAERYADADELIAALEAERARLPAIAARAAALAPEPVHGTLQPRRHRAATGPMLVAPPLPYRTGTAGRRRRRAATVGSLWWSLGALLVAGAVAAAILLLGSSNNTKVRVPDVAGQTEQAASASLRRVGLTGRPSLAPSPTVRSGLRLQPDPAPPGAAREEDASRSSSPAGPGTAPSPTSTDSPIRRPKNG